MTKIRRARVLAMFGFLFLSHQPTATERIGTTDQRQTQSRVATAKISGRVIDARTGLGITSAQVVASPESRFGGQWSAATDDSGAFEIVGLPAGRYQLTATKEGYLQGSHGKSDSADRAKPVAIASGESFDAAVIPLTKGGVITGVVLDRAGQPVPSVQVTPLRSRYVQAQGKRQLIAVARAAITDDRGEFRLHSLVPGVYYVIALPTNSAASARNAQTGLTATYHPSATNPSEALPVQVRAADVVSLSMTLATAKLARLSGQLVGLEGPVPLGATVGIRADGGRTGRSVSIAPDGTFAAPGLAPGTYFLQTQITSPAGNKVFATSAYVDGEDLTVQVPLLQVSKVRGRLTGVDGATLLSAKNGKVTITATPTRFEGVYLPNISRARVSQDLTFEFDSWPGIMNLELLGLPTGVSISTISVAGHDVTDEGIRLVGGRSVDDIEIEVTTSATSLSGSVQDAKQRPVGDYTVLLFAENKERWGSTRGVALGRPDQTGQFRITSVQPGRYYAIAVDRVSPDDWPDPKLLEAARRFATIVTLAEKQNRALTLQLRLLSEIE